MSDYIRKSEVMSMLTQVDLRYGTITDAKANLSKMPTLDEKEIIRKPMERIAERLEEQVTLERMNKMEDRVGKRQTTGFCLGVNASIEIVKEEGGIE